MRQCGHRSEAVKWRSCDLPDQVVLVSTIELEAPRLDEPLMMQSQKSDTASLQMVHGM